MSEIINIKANTYSVTIGSLANGGVGQYVLSNYRLSDTFILVDEHTQKLCLPALEGLFSSEEGVEKVEKILISSGELNKTLDTITSITRHLSSCNASRRALLINLGGGVLCDTGGFAASIYKRGIDFINIPTTLLSQVDASIGGKVGVDLDGLKNYLGVFNNPRAVYIDPEFLKTLSKREIIAGFAEVIKHGLIADREYFELIKKHDLEYSTESKERWSELIARSVEIKNEIVLSDPTEQGQRKVLNFGHTVGHAIETFFLESESPLLHGEAIGIGMVCELFLSCSVTGFNEDLRDAISNFILANFQKRTLEQSEYDQIISNMYADKKNQEDRINFTFLSDIGSPLVDQHADEAAIGNALDYYSGL